MLINNIHKFLLNIPQEPGVYKFLSEDKKVLYVGKAKNLKNRLKNYFQTDKSKLHGVTGFMMQNASTLEWTIVHSEVEALTLEWEWIQKHKPKYNILFKDNKSFPYVIISAFSKEPQRIFISRSQKYKSYKYYGPFLSAGMIHKVLDSLIKIYPSRTCTSTIFSNAKKNNRPCLK
jgi:excinuclease ABC subunit C